MSELPDMTGDWRDIRFAAEAADPQWKDRSNDERGEIWALLERFVSAFPRLRSRCINCRKQFAWSQIYRCFDCHAPLCRDCIKPHCEEPSK